MGHRLVGCVVVAAVVVLAGGCGSDGAAPRPTASAAPSGDSVPPAAPTAPLPAAPPGSGTVRDTGVPLTDPAAPGPVAGALLPVPGAALTVEDATDGSTVRTVTGPTPGGPAGVLAWVTAPRDGRVEVQQDGSATLHDAAGAVVAALGTPTGADGSRGTWRAMGDLLALDGVPGSASFVVGTSAVGSATWGDADGGRSLLVVPAPWVRGGSLAAQAALASQLAVAVPEAASASMQAQLWCHVLGAPDKASWNLEPWRPEVSTATMLLTRCNPDA